MNVNSRIARANFTGFASGAIASFTGLRASPIKVRSYINAIQEGSGDPYPAGGGANKWDEEWRNGYYSNGAFVSNPNYVCSKNQITILPNTSYYAYNGEASGRVIIAQYDSNGDFISNILVRNAVFTTDSNAVSINFYIEAQLQTYQHNVAINYPSSVTTYSPYSNIRPISGRDSVTIMVNSVDHEIELGDTVYGGILDVTNGELTVDKAITEVNPDNLGISVDIFTYWISGMTPGNAMNGMCNRFSVVSSSGSFGVRLGANNNAAYFYKLMYNIPEITDLESAKTWFTDNPVTILYPLATPITVQLTPTEISQIIGSNSISSDSGNVEVYFVTI